MTAKQAAGTTQTCESSFRKLLILPVFDDYWHSKAS